MKTPQIKTTRVALPQIYAYTTPRVPDHDGMVKIGYTEQTLCLKVRMKPLPIKPFMPI